MSNELVPASDLIPFQVRVTEDLLQAVENWRRKQKRIPSVSESIRRLVMMGIEADEEHGPQSEPLFPDVKDGDTIKITVTGTPIRSRDSKVLYVAKRGSHVRRAPNGDGFLVAHPDEQLVWVHFDGTIEEVKPL